MLQSLFQKIDTEHSDIHFTFKCGYTLSTSYNFAFVTRYTLFALEGRPMKKSICLRIMHDVCLGLILTRLFG